MPGLGAPSPPIVLRPHCMLADDATTFTVTRKGWWRRKYLQCKSSWTCGVGVEGGCITGRCDVTSQLLYWFSQLPEPFPSVPTHSISRIDCVKCWMTSCYWHRFFLASLESSDFCGGFSPKLRRSTWDDEKEKMRKRQMTKEIFQDVESWSAERMRMIDPIAHAQENFALRKDPLSTLALKCDFQSVFWWGFLLFAGILRLSSSIQRFPLRQSVSFGLKSCFEAKYSKHYIRIHSREEPPTSRLHTPPQLAIHPEINRTRAKKKPRTKQNNNKVKSQECFACCELSPTKLRGKAKLKKK